MNDTKQITIMADKIEDLIRWLVANRKKATTQQGLAEELGWSAGKLSTFEQKDPGRMAVRDLEAYLAGIGASYKIKATMNVKVQNLQKVQD